MISSDELWRHQSSRSDTRLRLKGWEAQEQPGVDILDRDKLFDLMNGR